VAADIPKYDLPDAAVLLDRLKAMPDPPSEFTAVMVLSLSMLPVAEASDDFWLDFDRSIVEFSDRYLGKVFGLAATERGVLIKITDYNQVGINSDVKVALLRLIQEHFPDNFGMVDQSRLVRTIDLRFKIATAQKMLERLVVTKDEESRPSSTRCDAFRKAISVPSFRSVMKLGRRSLPRFSFAIRKSPLSKKAKHPTKSCMNISSAWIC